MNNRGFIIVEPIHGYCGTGCTMGILNYFYKTTFGTKDTFDILSLIKFGNFDWQKNNVPDECEIGYFLYKFGFKIELYSDEIGGYKKFSINPKKYLDDNKMVPYPALDIYESANIMKKILEEKNINVYENEKFDLYELIEYKQHRSTLFLIGLDWYTLHDEERKNNDHGGHLVICSGVKEGKFIIHDPGPNIVFEMLVEKEKIYQAMRYNGGGTGCTLIQYI